MICSFSDPPDPGLNRTSVGLKQLLLDNQREYAYKPQSNQRGIETPLELRQVAGQLPPQSNQRGIETMNISHSPSRMKSGLNRTSVGLKPTTSTKIYSYPGRPQSNQRGIETREAMGINESNKLASIEPAWD